MHFAQQEPGINYKYEVKKMEWKIRLLGYELELNGWELGQWQAVILAMLNPLAHTS